MLAVLDNQQRKIAKQKEQIESLEKQVSHLKKAERGYNQSEFNVKGMSSKLRIPYTTRALKRVRYTESQTAFNLEQREKNISNAFKVKNKNKIIGKNILIVDDVITTGSTIGECGKALLESGSKSVYACSVAIAD